MNDDLAFKGFTGSVEYSSEDGCYIGRVLGIIDCIIYEGQDLEAIKVAFETSINNYIDYCSRKKLTRPT